MDKRKSHYKVEATFWKEPLRGSNYLFEKRDKLCRIDKTFCDNNLFNARKEAFGYYQSLIDVLYEALGGSYESDRQARKDLQAYLHAGCKQSTVTIGKMVFDDNLFNEIAVYWVNGNTKRLIHGIWYKPKLEQDVIDEQTVQMGSNLVKEYRFYNRHRLPYPDETLCDMTDIGLGFELVLPTPFDWDNFAEENLFCETQALCIYNARP